VKPKLYLETTIPGSLAAWPSRDLIRAARQQITREWWGTRRLDFELFISEFVIQEVSAGDQTAAAERLKLFENIAILQVSDDANVLARELLRQVPLPLKAAVDALHIAMSAVNAMDYLLTWNCAHIANATSRGGIESVCRNLGYEPPRICIPEELMGGLNTMSLNSLVDEIRAERETYAARFNYDLWAIYRDIKVQERNSGRAYVSLIANRLSPRSNHPSDGDRD
jgi:hypothetical protein